MVALIRYLVEIPTEFEYRMHIRKEFIASGLQPVFKRMKEWASEEYCDILQHVDAFEELKTSDFVYLLDNMDSELKIDIDNPSELLEILKKQLSETENKALSCLIQNIVVGVFAYLINRLSC
jgi:hypothetical protein